MNKKFIINADEVVHLYEKTNATMHQIASQYGCDKRVISRVLKRSGVEIKRHRREYSFYYEQSLNLEQKDLIYGSLLGDGGVYRHHEGKNGCRYAETHSIDQIEYLQWKKSILHNFISKDISIIDNAKSKTFGNRPTCVLISVLHSDFDSIRNLFYIDGKKIAPYFNLSPISLAAWFFDDGSVSKNGKHSWFASFHTEGFTANDVNVLRSMLFDSYKIDSYVVNVKKNKQIIRLNNKEYAKLCDIIKPFTIPCMAYKNKLFNNPVETCSAMSGASNLKCFDANMSGSLFH